MTLPLATLIHISDLHFGSKFVADEGLIKKLAAGLAQAMYTHSYQAARSLAARINQIIGNRRKRQVPTCVVFTGDLTGGGDPNQFAVGDTFLRSAFSMGAGDDVGLRLDQPRQEIGPEGDVGLFLVPGNHDIWGRTDPAALGAFKRHFPDVYPNLLVIRTRTRPIVLFGVDSTQNARGRHMLARGRVSPEQCDRACMLLQENAWVDAVRIVCLHHPLADAPGKTYRVRMRLEDREGVALRFAAAGADLVLAGHLHDRFARQAGMSIPPQVVTGSGTQQFSERSFCVLNVYEEEIRVYPFEYNKTSFQFEFVPPNPADEADARIFPMSRARASTMPGAAGAEQGFLA